MLWHVSEFHSFLRLLNTLLCVFTIFYLSTLCSWTFGLLPPFGSLNSTAMDIGVQIFDRVPAFSSFVWLPSSRIARHTVVLWVVVEETTILFSAGAASCYVSTSKAQGFQSLQGLASTCCFLFFIFIVMGVKWYLGVVLICVWLMSNAVEHICLWTSSAGKCLFKPFSHF